MGNISSVRRLYIYKEEKRKKDVGHKDRRMQDRKGDTRKEGRNKEIIQKGRKREKDERRLDKVGRMDVSKQKNKKTCLQLQLFFYF